MAITADALLAASGLGYDAFDYDTDAEVEAMIEGAVLPIAAAEVDTAVGVDLGSFPSVAALLLARFPGDDVAQTAALAQFEALHHASEISFGLNDLFRRVASRAPEYYQASNDNRIQGNQRLAKLREFLRNLVSGVPGDATDNDGAPLARARRMRSILW